MAPTVVQLHSIEPVWDTKAKFSSSFLEPQDSHKIRVDMNLACPEVTSQKQLGRAGSSCQAKRDMLCKQELCQSCLFVSLFDVFIFYESPQSCLEKGILKILQNISASRDNKINKS